MSIRPSAPSKIEGSTMQFNYAHGDNDYVIPFELRHFTRTGEGGYPEITNIKPLQVGNPGAPPKGIKDFLDVSIPDVSIDAFNASFTPRVPLFLGARQRIAERRAEKASERIDELQKENEVARYVGESLYRGGGFTKLRLGKEQPNPRRPHTKSEKRTASKLEDVVFERANFVAHQHEVRARVHTLSRLDESKVRKKERKWLKSGVREVEGEKSTFTLASIPSWKTLPLENLDPQQQKIRKRLIGIDRHADHKIHELDEKFKALIGSPHREIGSVARKQAKLEAKAAGLNDAVQERKARRTDRRETVRWAAQIIGQLAAANVAEKSDELRATGRSAKKAFGDVIVDPAKEITVNLREAARPEINKPPKRRKKHVARRRQKKNVKDEGEEN